MALAGDLRLTARGWANGLWMLAVPLHWYNNVPAGVPDYGPFNAHFVRDVGIAFLTVGAALGWAAGSSTARFELVAVAAIFAVLHGVLHVEVEERQCNP